jgi:hydrogenase maturation protease
MTRSGVLIQCIGNPMRRDDGVGPWIAARLRELDPPGPVAIQEHWGEGTALMQHWDPDLWVLLVDASYSGGSPGAIRHFDARYDRIPRDFCYYATHRFGVAEAIELARSLDRLPARMDLYTVEGVEFGFGADFTPTVAAAAERLAALVASLLAERR